MEIMQQALQIFYAISGLKINLLKSSVFGIGVDRDEVEGLGRHFGCKADSLPMAMSYLGIPVGARMNRIKEWKPLFNKLSKRLAGWNAKLLSIGGRLTLLSAVLGSLDCWKWSLEGKHIFTVRNVRHYIDRTSLTVSSPPTRWNPLIPKKVNMFIWRLLRNAIPTRMNLFARGIDVNTFMCVLCTAGIDFNDHLFGSCSFSIQVWKKLRSWLQIDDLSLALPHQMMAWLDTYHKEILEAIFFLWWWCFWKHRNNLVFEKEATSSKNVFSPIVSLSFLWMSSRCKSTIFSWPLWRISPRHLM
uniref:uncharacterized protein LOC122585965 n=1 Tax=Erigeron canadensis TaxID=72917 RepID=UPI001CB8EE92|nr:uncharacterized protein LOC122585965 [Erigeron canadensis]